MEGVAGAEWREATRCRTLVSPCGGEGVSGSGWCHAGREAGSRAGPCTAGSPGGPPGTGVGEADGPGCGDVGRHWGTCRGLSITFISQ